MIDNLIFKPFGGHFLHTVKWFPVLLFLVVTQFNVFKHCFFNTNNFIWYIPICLHIVKWFRVFVFIVNFCLTLGKGKNSLTSPQFEHILEATYMKQREYGYIPPISQPIKIRQTRHNEYCWWSKDELVSYVLRWTPTHRHTSISRSARTYTHQICADTGFILEDLPG